MVQRNPGRSSLRALKLAIFSESPSDEEALRILVEAILGKKTQPVQLYSLRSRGWPSTLHNVPSVLRHLHYRTDAEALIIVVDSDKSPVHLPSHEQPDGIDTECRLCQLSSSSIDTMKKLRPVEGRKPIKVGLGLAVPSIEAWLRCGLDTHITETAWTQALEMNSFPYTVRSLKQDAYGTTIPSLGLEKECAMAESKRLAKNLEVLENFFPNGFGALARHVRGW